MRDYSDYDATGLARLVAKRLVTAGELLDAALDRVERHNPALNAVVQIQEGAARRLIAEGLPEGPFKGVPFLLKDLAIEAQDFPSDYGSRLMENTRQKGDSTLYTRLKAAGLVTFGRTTSPEGGIGAVTEASVYGGPTRNPWNLAHTPGGSSGGAGAAVAAGILPAAHGSDGGGSVRIPASSSGLFGFKPTRGLLPAGPYRGEGWAGMAIDGFLTRSVRDTAALLDATMGADSGTPYHAPPLREGFTAALHRAPRPLKIALCDTSFTGTAIHPECKAAVHSAAKLLNSMGHHIEEARLEANTEGMMAAWTKIVACGTAAAVRRALVVKSRVLQESDLENVSQSALRYAETITGADYVEALAKIHAYGRELAAFFDGYDILLTPTLAEPPAKIGRFDHTRADYVDYRTGPDGIFAYSPFTAAFNASGQPAMSVPLAMSSNGLPIGIHFAAAQGQDELLMSLAADLERAAPWFHRHPPHFG